MAELKSDVQAPKTASPALDVVFRPDVQALIEEANEWEGVDLFGADALIKRLTAALSTLSGETETEWEYGVRYIEDEPFERRMPSRGVAMLKMSAPMGDVLIRRRPKREIPAGQWEVVS